MNLYEKIIIPVAVASVIGGFGMAWKTNESMATANSTLERVTEQVGRNAAILDRAIEKQRVMELDIAILKERIRRTDEDE